MAMVSYRTPQAYHQKFNRLRNADAQHFEVQKYLHYQVLLLHLIALSPPS
jgi:homoserine acetyltransferase